MGIALFAGLDTRVSFDRGKACSGNDTNLIFRAFLNCMTRVIRQANDKELNGIPNIFDLGRLPFHSEVLSPKAMLDVHSMQ